MNQEKIGKFISDLRKEKNMTQAVLAEKMQVSVNAVSKWERGLSCPDVSLLRPLSEELNISVNELLLGEKILDTEIIKKTDENIINTIEYKNKENSNLLKKYIINTSIIIFIILIILGWNLFIKGRFDSNFNYNITVKEDTLYLSGNLLDSNKVYNSSNINKKNGKTIININSSYQSIFNNNGSFNITYNLKENEEVYLEDDLIWKDNKEISSLANKLYKVRNPYIGNMSANGKISGALGISNLLGNYMNKLQTSNEPYEWNLIFENEYNSEDSIFLNKKMNQYAVVLLAMVDNLGIVKWTWNDGINEHQESLSINDANKKIDELKQANNSNNIKDYNKSIYLINELLNMLDMV